MDELANLQHHQIMVAGFTRIGRHLIPLVSPKKDNQYKITVGRSSRLVALERHNPKRKLQAGFSPHDMPLTDELNLCV
ncbi:MAG: hypothetical protein JEZ00_18085 [Anaerolineaceae bacterium]|nr:hypothetical protein [Anaerolineaceae bacterium]